ncbi:hypothetical protein KDN34_03055 [Shewanella yunxiaonensis]|uniref:Uncharacterized protein n=1 Tax=Shewanella yunxiaonensis TaxID=2829809 RepID=A0ABX7YWC1_9GAMM|nr:hypothetical protein [Shewanella yunxiaonensis]QUN06456.1 hypothetical protein KDN34_03055 [Shewanella yunxiaonensis]
MEPRHNYAAEVLNAPLASANISALLEDVSAYGDQVRFKLLVAELFTLSVLDLHAELAQMAAAKPEVCVAAAGSMLQSLEGVISARALRQREVICRAISLACAEVIAADRTATEDEDD